MGKIINGKTIAEKILEKTVERVALLKKKKIFPKLAVVWVGSDKPSKTYIKNKKNAAKKIGIGFKLHKFKNNINQAELIKKINNIQSDKKLTGLIVQLPLPKHLNTDKILNVVKPEIDVDCLTGINSKKLAGKKIKILPPTPAAILAVLKELKINLKNKRVVIVGYGRLVGKPLAIILKKMGVKTKICRSKTKNLKKQCLWGNVVISAVGKANLISGDMVRQGAIVIDAGVSFDEKGRMRGDVDFKKVEKKAKYITPTPGGIGPITVAKLLENAARCAEI